MATSKGPGLYEFLIEAELQQYYTGFKSDLKIQNVPQLKYVTEDDLISIGMSKPEMRRLKKFFQRHFPQNYLSKFKKLILSKREENHDPILSISNEAADKPSIKVPNKHIIPAEAIVVNKELGQGEFGTVQQGVWTDEEDRIQVAIKCLSRERMHNNPIEFLKEAAIMHGIDHEHIVRLYGVVLDTNSLMLVTELAPLRSLLECLKEPSLRASFPVLSLCDFAIQICDGMQYLEQKRLIHRDLAARNILVFSKNKVKISDFGLSRALGVGKDYYQTNFNVNLKLPIAWCAPECISYLRFTSASDMWAYGVTLWEMFSYGFQPWAALTGHQILEAIDEPNFQRLEQPECCPREHYTVMVRCWNHDPAKRPRFSDLMTVLPDCKPEQVQAAQEFVEDPNRSKRDQLAYRVGDVITVLDKPQGVANCWKGVVNSGKTGLFNPAHTVAYLGSNLPSSKSDFVRGDGKNTYSSKRKIRPEMISGPQGDLKHTGHVGLDGAYFGDLSFLGGKNPNLPRQIVTPYKPHEDSSSLGTDSNHAEMSRTCSDVSDCTPLLRTPHSGESVGASGPNGSSSKCSDVSDCTPLLRTPHSEHPWTDGGGGKTNTEHEYHEISEDEDLAGSPVFNKNFDYGPSLMDEMESVLRSFGSSPTHPADKRKPPPPFQLPCGIGVSTPPASPLAEAINVKNELKEMAAKAAGRRKQATVKPISAADEKTLDCAIAMANELTAKSMNDLDGVTPPESPHTPASPSKRKFSFRFPSVQRHPSPRADRKNFTEQAACIPDIQSSLSREAKEVYSSLVEQPVLEVQTILPVASLRHSLRERDPPPSLTTFGHPAPAESNPLRMLRSGAFPMVRPKTQKHLPKIRVPPPLPPTTLSGEESSQDRASQDRTSQSSDRSVQEDNPIPLPPRDRSRPSVSNKARHQRKYPLIIPGQDSLDDDDVFYPQSAPTTPTVETAALPALPSLHAMQHQQKSADEFSLHVCSQEDGGFDDLIATELDALDDINTDTEYCEESSPSRTTDCRTECRTECRTDETEDTVDHFLPVRRSRRFEEDADVDEAARLKPNLHLRQTIAQLNQMYSQPESDGFSTTHEDIQFADSVDGEEDEAMRRNDDHVSCEDLLEFSAKARSKSRGPDSDQVRIMTKVLGKEVTSDTCLAALEATDWEVHGAIKVARLQNLVQGSSTCVCDAASCWDALSACNGDVARAANLLLQEQFPPDFV